MHVWHQKTCLREHDGTCLSTDVRDENRSQCGVSCAGTLGAVDDGVETAEAQRPYNCQEAGADGPAASPGPAVSEGLDLH